MWEPVLHRLPASPLPPKKKVLYYCLAFMEIKSADVVCLNIQFAVIKKMADVDFTTMLCEPELVMITARTVLFAYIDLGINNIYLTNFMVLMLCLFGYLFQI